MHQLINFLMDEDEILNALTAYRNDPREETIESVIAAVLTKAEAAKKELLVKLPHDFVIVPHVTSLKFESSFQPHPDKEKLNLAKALASISSRVHELGGTAVYFRMSDEAWDRMLYTSRIATVYRMILQAKSLTDFKQIQKVMYDLMWFVLHEVPEESRSDVETGLSRHVRGLTSTTPVWAMLALDYKFSENMPQQSVNNDNDSTRGSDHDSQVQ